MNNFDIEVELNRIRFQIRGAIKILEWLSNFIPVSTGNLGRTSRFDNNLYVHVPDNELINSIEYRFAALQFQVNVLIHYTESMNGNDFKNYKADKNLEQLIIDFHYAHLFILDNVV